MRLPIWVAPVTPDSPCRLRKAQGSSVRALTCTRAAVVPINSMGALSSNSLQHGNLHSNDLLSTWLEMQQRCGLWTMAQKMSSVPSDWPKQGGLLMEGGHSGWHYTVKTGSITLSEGEAHSQNAAPSFIFICGGWQFVVKALPARLTTDGYWACWDHIQITPWEFLWEMKE